MKKAMGKDEILAKIAECPKEDFDGHTDFRKLSPKEKLLWLSNTAYFVYQMGCENPGLECNRFFRAGARMKK